MGNEIRLPTSTRKDDESKRKIPQHLLKQQLMQDMTRKSKQMDYVVRKNHHLESNIEELTDDLSSYKKQMKHLKKTLHQIDQDKVTVGLVHESYVEKAKVDLCKEPINAENITNDEYTEFNISLLESQVAILSKEVARNEELISAHIEKQNN